MEESFEVRVKRLFGSQLFDTVPRSSFPATSWSVADGEVERKEWNRERGAGPDRSDDPSSSAFAESGCFSKKKRGGVRRSFESDMDELDDDNDDDDEDEEHGRGAVEVEKEDKDEFGRDADELEMRSFVGLDPTLDNEEEEDEFDRAALGKDDAGERLYMRDVKNHGPHLNYHCLFTDADEPYTGSHHLHKDPRADHFSAGMRLEEDKKTAQFFSLPTYSKDEHPPSSTTALLPVTTVDDIKLKPILKRKELHDDSKPKKRVRFDPGCITTGNGNGNGNDEVLKEEAEDSAIFSHFMEAPAAADSSLVMLQESPAIPDYMRNPSKYTHYTFDSYEHDDLENISAFLDFHNSYKKLNPEQPHQQVAMDLPKSITFKPRRKPIDAMPVDNESGDVQENNIRKEFLENDLMVIPSPSVGIAASESYEAGICKMDEDELEITISDERLEPSRRGRKYRSRATSDD